MNSLIKFLMLSLDDSDVHTEDGAKVCTVAKKCTPAEKKGPSLQARQAQENVDSGVVDPKVDEGMNLRCIVCYLVNQGCRGVATGIAKVLDHSLVS